MAADRAEALALVAQVGVSEAARRLGMPKGTIGRWAAEAKRRNETPETVGGSKQGGAGGKAGGKGMGGRAPPATRPPSENTRPSRMTREVADQATREALVAMGVDPDTVPMGELARIALRRELLGLAAGTSNKPNQSALAVAILADKVHVIEAVERGEIPPEEKAAEPASEGELEACLDAAAAATGRLPAPDEHDDYDPETAGGARAPGVRLVASND